MPIIYLNPALDIPQRVQARVLDPNNPNKIIRKIIELTPGDKIEVDNITASDLLGRTVNVNPTEEMKSTLNKSRIAYTTGGGCCGRVGTSLRTSLVIEEDK